MTCAACRAALPAGARFCSVCGAPAASSPGVPADSLRAALEESLGFQYRIERLLGRGGMGAVYLARELALDRDVAVKVLPPDRLHAADALERFRREARTAARLSHPNIVPLYTFGEVKGLVYFVMGYVRGETLAAHVRRSGRLGVEEVRRILVDVTDALTYAHAQGVVHRDIKPDNILIDAESGRPMLTDFGVAKALSVEGTLTATGLVVGTPQYMSPEQAAGRADIDGRSDVYSLGVMGYALLAGRLPFEGTTPADVLVQHLTKQPPPLQGVAPDAPHALAATLMRCLAKDPSERWQDARDLKRALAPDESAPELPAKVRALSVCLQGGLAFLLLYGYIRLALAADPSQTSLAAIFRDPAEKLVLVFAVAGAFTAVQARRQLGLSVSAILRYALLQPSWWPGWYPRRLRRPGDLWDRLPPAIRMPRQLLGAALVAWALVLIPLSVAKNSGGDYYERTGRQTAVGALADLPKAAFLMPLVLLCLATIFGAVFATLWLRRRLGPLYEFEFDEMPVFGATWKRSSPWRRPAYQALLRPLTEASSPRSDEELERAVVSMADALPPALADAAPAVRSAARSLRAGIARLDREIATLTRDADAQEAARLEAKLAALGPPSDGEPPDRRQMRELLAQQRSLFQDMAARLERTRSERARRAELLRALWTRIARLTPAADARSRDELRDVCAEIGRLEAAQRQDDVSELPTLQR